MGYDFEKIFDEIDRLVSSNDRQEGEFTSLEYARGKTRAWALQRLAKAERAGKVTRRRGIVDGHFCNLYTFVEKDA